ncbi:MAG TPA: hypothetical protein VJK02_00995 [Anaerolineales bacterium]|nr:hypothetical protein [Anaerolineales bacterium]
MDWAQIVTQAGLVFLKEGLNFVFSSFKDKKAAQQAQDQQEVKAKEDAAQSVAQEHPKVVPPPAPGLRLDKVATIVKWFLDAVTKANEPGFQKQSAA